MAANGTSQDSCDSETIKKIGLAAKAAGADLQHIGDSMNGICLPQNIFNARTSPSWIQASDRHAEPLCDTLRLPCPRYIPTEATIRYNQHAN